MSFPGRDYKIFCGAWCILLLLRRRANAVHLAHTKWKEKELQCDPGVTSSPSHTLIARLSVPGFWLPSSSFVVLPLWQDGPMQCPEGVVSTRSCTQGRNVCPELGWTAAPLTMLESSYACSDSKDGRSKKI